MTLRLHARTEESLQSIEGRLHTEFPDVPEDEVAAEVETTTDELLETARIEAFVPVLVHRYARAHLLEKGAHSTGSADPPPDDLTPAA